MCFEHFGYQILSKLSFETQSQVFAVNKDHVKMCTLVYFNVQMAKVWQKCGKSVVKCGKSSESVFFIHLKGVRQRLFHRQSNKDHFYENLF